MIFVVLCNFVYKYFILMKFGFVQEFVMLYFNIHLKMFELVNLGLI